MRTLSLTLGLFCSIMAFSQTPKLNTKMVKYAKRHMNTKVGKGVCWELVYQALRYCRANMGDTVCYDSIQPGDIAYSGALLLVINGYTPGSELRPEIARGRDSVPNIVDLYAYPHIGIVGKVYHDGRFEMYEQNVQGSHRKSRVVCRKKDLYNWHYDSTTVLPIVYFDRSFIRPKRGSAVRDLVHFGCKTTNLEKVGFAIAGVIQDLLEKFHKRYDPSDPVLFPGDEIFVNYEDEMLDNDCWIPSDLVYNLYKEYLK